MERWSPKREIGQDETYILKLVAKKRKLFGFLRLHRHELFDDALQEELESIYRTTGAGLEAEAPGVHVHGSAGLQRFRARLIASNMDRRLLEHGRTRDKEQGVRLEETAKGPTNGG
jgi:hypothetical protein